MFHRRSAFADDTYEKSTVSVQGSLGLLGYLDGCIHSCRYTAVQSIPPMGSRWGGVSGDGRSIYKQSTSSVERLTSSTFQYLRLQALGGLDVITELGLFALAVYLVWDIRLAAVKKATVIIVFALRLP